MSEHSDYPLIMTQGEPIVVTAPLPNGYSFRFFEPELTSTWCQLQCAVHRFPDEKSARRTFDRIFKNSPYPLHKRMIFAIDPTGRCIATGYLGEGRDLSRLMDQICWLALLPGFENTGIERALVAKLMDLFYQSKHTNGIYFVTSPEELPYIRLMQEFGFSPYLGFSSSDSNDRASYFATAQTVWEQVVSRLQEMESHMVRSTTSPMIFRHSSIFNKCPSCKVYTLTAPTQSGIPLHSHDYAQIWYVTRGVCEHFVEGQQHKMMVGDAFILPPNVIHSTTLQEGGSIICCEFYIEDLFPDSSSKRDRIYDLTRNLSFTILFQESFQTTHAKFSLSQKGQRQVELLMRSMLDEYTRAEDYFDDYLYLQIMQLLIIFEREYALPSVHDDSEKVYNKYRTMVLDTISYIDTHYAEPLTLDDVCKLSMVSKTYFCYLFKMLTNQTFVEYLVNRRIERATELLCQSNMPVTTIGQVIGFHDSTNFSRTFKRLKGVSPSEYRNARR